MFRLLMITWMTIPVFVMAWHFGPGQFHWVANGAGKYLRQADQATKQTEWREAAAAYAGAREALPEDATHGRRRLELAEASARIKAGEMIAGQEQLEKLIADMHDDRSTDPDLEASARHELATASYHAAWLMRLEGATPDEWNPEAERARQQFRLLAERAEKSGDTDDARTANHRNAQVFKTNLEATIKLQQMDLSELLAKPLPKNCPSCKNLSQRKRKQCQSRCQGKGEGKKKGKGQGKKKKDARAKIKESNSAGLNQREGKGS